MKFSTFLSIVAIVALLFGITFLLLPGALLAQYGVTGADAHTIIMSRFFGAALINLGILLWVARNVVESQPRKAMMLSGLAGNVVGFFVALNGQMHGVTNALGWSTVVIYGLFAVGFAYFQFARTPAVARK